MMQKRHETEVTKLSHNNPSYFAVYNSIDEFAVNFPYIYLLFIYLYIYLAYVVP